MIWIVFNLEAYPQFSLYWGSKFARKAETPEGSAGPENPIRLPSHVCFNEAEFS